jgi:hypothetical protein
VSGPTTDCTPQACVNAACTVGCMVQTDCAPSYNCQIAKGATVGVCQ